MPPPGARSGTADLPLHGGRVPRWLAQRMERLGRVLVEAIILHYGRDEVLARLSHPFWFQSLGCVMGMDFTDPARFSLAHGGKDGHLFRVPLRVFDETIRVMRQAVDAARLGNDERLAAVRRLDVEARRCERAANGLDFDAFVAEERRRSHEHGGRTVHGAARPPAQLELFGRHPAAPSR